MLCNILRLVIVVWRTQGPASDLDASVPANLVDSVRLLAAGLLRRQQTREDERLREEEEAARREEADRM